MPALALGLLLLPELVELVEVAPSPYLLSSNATVGFVVVEVGSIPYALSRIEVAGSTGVVEVVFEFARLNRSSTHCTVCATALSAFAIACDGVVFNSLWTVAKADCAVERFPELIADPSAVMSLDSCEGLAEVDDEVLLAVAVDEF